MFDVIAYIYIISVIVLCAILTLGGKHIEANAIEKYVAKNGNVPNHHIVDLIYIGILATLPLIPVFNTYVLVRAIQKLGKKR